MDPAITRLSPTNDNTTASPRVKTKTPAHTLNRVRNNQRRHRERRREYIASLEQKLQKTEALLVQAKADIAGLKAEVGQWKSGNGTEEHLSGRTSTRNYSGSLPVLSPAEWQPKEVEQQRRPMVDVVGETSILSSYSVSGSASVATTVIQDVSEPLRTTFNFGTTDLSKLSMFPSQAPYSSPPNGHAEHPSDYIPSVSLPRCCSSGDEPHIPAFADSLAPDFQDLTLLPSACDAYPSSDVESTTLCTQAYRLIAQQNFQGLNAGAIRSWLDQGFRRPQSQKEGCRVENKLMLGLLDFISGS